MGDLEAVERLREQLAQEIADAESRLKDLRRRYAAAIELLTLANPSATVDNVDTASRVAISRSLTSPSKGLKALQKVGLTLRGAAEKIGVDPSLLSRALRGERKLNPAAQAKLDALLTK